MVGTVKSDSGPVVAFSPVCTSTSMPWAMPKVKAPLRWTKSAMVNENDVVAATIPVLNARETGVPPVATLIGMPAVFR